MEITNLKKVMFTITLAIAAGVFLFSGSGFAETVEFLMRIDSYEDFVDISSEQFDVNFPQIVRGTRYLVPTANVNGAPDYTVFQNINLFYRHDLFINQAIDPVTGEPFRPGLTSDEFAMLVSYRDTREYYAGVLCEIHDGRDVFFGFVIERWMAELLEQDEIAYMYNKLRTAIGLSWELKYTPIYEDQIEKAHTFVNPPFPIYYFPENVPEEVLPPREVQAHAGYDGENLLIRLDWMPSETEGVDGYRIYRDFPDNAEAGVSGNVNCYIDYNVSEGNYYYRITAVDRDVGESARFGPGGAGAEVSRVNHTPYFYPPLQIQKDWFLPEEEIVIEVKGYDPDGDSITYSFNFPTDPTGANFIYNSLRDVYEFNWQTSNTGAYPVTFYVEDNKGNRVEEEIEIVVANPNDNVIYIDGEALFIMEMHEEDGRTQFGFNYDKVCKYLTAPNESNLYTAYIRTANIRKANTSFTSNDILGGTNIDNIEIPLSSPGSMVFHISNSYLSRSTLWLEKIEDSSNNEYRTIVKEEVRDIVGHIIVRYLFTTPFPIRYGDININDVYEIHSGSSKGLSILGQNFYYNFNEPDRGKYVLVEYNHSNDSVIIGGSFRLEIKVGYSFILYDGPAKVTYYSQTGTTIGTYDKTENIFRISNPDSRIMTVGLTAENPEYLYLQKYLTATINCYEIRLQEPNAGYYGENSELLFYITYWYDENHFPRPDYVLAGYEFGDSVILPHLDENSFVVQLQSKRFDFPVKFVDFRPAQNDYIEFFNIKPQTLPQAGQKSLRLHRTVQPNGTKYEYIEYLASGVTMDIRWNENGNLIYSSHSPPEAEDFIAKTDMNISLEIDLSKHASDPEPEEVLTYSVGNARHGTVELVGNIATYTPYSNYTGVDSFIYTAIDSVGLYDTGKVLILVLGDGFNPIPSIGEIRNAEPSRVSVDADENVIYIEEVEYGNAINSDAEYYPGSLRFHITGGIFENPPKHGDNPNPPKIVLSGDGADQINAYGGMELQYDGTYEPYGVIEWTPSSQVGDITVEVVDNLGAVSRNRLILRIDVLNAPRPPIRVPEDYSTIEEAVRHAEPGDTIEISAGSYEFERDLILPVGINLIGEDAGVTEIRGLYPEVVGGGNPRAAAVVVGSNSIIKGLTLHSNVILQGVTNVVIEECISDAQPISYHPGRFYGNWFNAAGITIDSTSFSNTISNNLMYGNPSIAVLGNNNEIRNNILVEYDNFNFVPWEERAASNLVIGGSNNKVVNNTCVMYLTEMTRNFGAEWVHNISIAAIEGHFVGSGNDVRNNIFRMYNKGEMEFMSIGLSNGVYQEPEGEVLFDYNFISDPSSESAPGVILGGNNITTAGGPMFIKDLFDTWSGFGTLLSLDFHLEADSPCINRGDPQPEYNDPDGTRNDMGAYGGPDSFGIIRVPEDTPNIQKAIERASAGDTILVAVGTYGEGKYSEDRCGTIVMKEGVDLIGRDKWTTSIEAEPPEGSWYPGLHTLYSVRGANNCKLQGFTLEGVLLDNVDNMVITDNIINGALLYHRNMSVGVKSGLIVQNGSSGNTISNNIITGRPPIYLRFMQDGEPIYPSNNKIYNNVVIAGRGASDLSLSGYGNEIVNNVFYINGDFEGVTNAANITITAYNSSNIIKNNIFYIKHETNPTLAEKKSISLEGEVAGGAITVDYNFIPYPVDEGITLGDGNITDIEDPGFIDLETFYLQIGSPCINRGDPQPEYNDPDGTRNDMGAYGGPQGAWASSTGGGE